LVNLFSGEMGKREQDHYTGGERRSKGKSEGGSAKRAAELMACPSREAIYAGLAKSAEYLWHIVNNYYMLMRERPSRLKDAL
jgi:hypothetical protein